MKLITPSFEIIEQKDLFKHIELCGRVCYKSEDNITETSSQKFIDNLIKSGHTSVLEHGTVYLRIPYLGWRGSVTAKYAKKYQKNSYSEAYLKYDPNCNFEYDALITTNFRVIHENGWQLDLQYQCEPTEFHEKRVTVKFICDRGILQEFRTHRVFGRDDDGNFECDIVDFSASAESTRYCNYSKDKFENNCTFILPCWLNDSEIIEEFGGLSLEYHKDIDKFQSSEWNDAANFLQSIAWSESNYFTLLGNGWTPQQARAVLPNSLKTELIMTGFIKDWKHFFKLRCDESAHPQARELAIPLCEEFKKRGYL